MTHCSIATCHGELQLPAFLPDATRGVVRGVDAADLNSVGIRGLVVNAFHLGSRPGMAAVAIAGGIHKFMAWDGPILSDSGGFQVLSLLGENPKNGAVTRKGITLRVGTSRERRLLTPEKSLQYQFTLGADLMVCLDYCTHPDMAFQRQQESVNLTVEWARRCKQEYMRRSENNECKPLLFAVVQGGDDAALRKQCAERLLEIGFDGYGFGGWPVRRDGTLSDMVHLVSELIPKEYPKWGLGIGNPRAMISAFRMGYMLFDCTMPTRDARHKRLYVLTSPAEVLQRRQSARFFEVLHIGDVRYRRDTSPVDSTCECICCRTYSRAYLHHLFQTRDSLALRLATLHNLRFYVKLIEILRSCMPCHGGDRSVNVH
jgi:queuine tRNA-ribosyltransferase